MKNFERIQRLQDIGHFSNVFTSAVEKITGPLSSVAATLAAHHEALAFRLPKAFDLPKVVIPQFPTVLSADTWMNSPLLKVLEGVNNFRRSVENNPEFQFAFITDLEILNLKSHEELKKTLVSDDTLFEGFTKSEEILDRNLSIYLTKYGLSPLWAGAEVALKSDNPDKLRHCLVSVRTLLEHVLDEMLAPKDELQHVEMFRKEFKNIKEGDKAIKKVRINRYKKIKYIMSKMTFRFYDEDFTTTEIGYICDCYEWLCGLHNPVIDLSENQVRTLKFKAGVTVWLLLYIYEATTRVE